MDKISVNSLNLLSATKTADYTITNIDHLSTIFVNPSARAISITLPTASENTDRHIRIKVTTTGGNVTVIGTIDGNTNLFLNRKDDFVDLTSNGTSWLINHCCCSYSTGWISTSDWASRSLGSMIIPYTGKSGTVVIGETFTEATSLNTWIITADSGSAFTCKEATGTGVATNARTLTGSTSGTTCTVNGNTKNSDSNVYHNLGVSITDSNFKFNVFHSTDKTEANTHPIGLFYADYQGVGFGITGSTVNDFIATAINQGTYYVTSAFSFVWLTNQDNYYKVIASYIK